MYWLVRSGAVRGFEGDGVELPPLFASQAKATGHRSGAGRGTSPSREVRFVRALEPVSQSAVARIWS